MGMEFLQNYAIPSFAYVGSAFSSIWLFQVIQQIKKEKCKKKLMYVFFFSLTKVGTAIFAV